MARRRWYDRPSTPITLSSGIDASTTTIPVSAGISGSVPDFVVEIDSERLLVTANPDTTSWTATRAHDGTTGTTHSSGAEVKVIQTKEHMEQWMADSRRAGLYSALPATSDAEEGDLYFTDDGPYEFFRFDGSAWNPYIAGIKCTVPPSTGWGWVNQGTSTVVSSNGAIELRVQDTGTANHRLYTRAVPSNPYTVTALFMIPDWDISLIGQAGLYLRDSVGGGLVSCYRVDVGTITSQKWTNPTTFSAGYTSTNDFQAPSHLFLCRFNDNSTNRTSSASLRGHDFWEVAQQLRTDFITPDEIGFGANWQNTTHGGSHKQILLLSWEVT